MKGATMLKALSCAAALLGGGGGGGPPPPNPPPPNFCSGGTSGTWGLPAT